MVTGPQSASQPASSTMSSFLSDYTNDALGWGRYMETNTAEAGNSTQYIFRKFGDMGDFALSQRSGRSAGAPPVALSMMFTPQDREFEDDGKITFAGNENRLLPPGAARSSISQTFQHITTSDNSRAHIGNQYSTNPHD